MKHLALSNITPQCFYCEVSPLVCPSSPHAFLSLPPFLPSQLQGLCRYSMFSPGVRVFCAYQRVLEDLLGARGGDVK